ncbi:ATP-dependent DNA helicase DinG [Paenibacillus sp. UNCCL117]|uniref:ATP-dependent DNA helicase n=1 Tax=unclassified Paenibacillus TaxID=185978 RepID=UPI00088BBBD3|nr:MULTISPECIES: ATP-dependent DNA helicase [unclassified Paenibacillus]SDD70772.1 ATP-dependent DNA helicase DinG [Paenibacillus sp. cl123]SFW45408.1 ATP-dependent DNA helicase DinG [Paenibacillus sp. UNCCL117]
MSRYPFAYDHSRPFVQQAGEWIADVFYDVLPEAGFEVRDEQIYMAYQVERAFAEKRTIFAEAGVGTGKTLVYLLYAVCYARYHRKPVVIACADESLIEQLVKPEGDIAKLSRHLKLDIDARLAKSPDQYICLNKLDEARLGHGETPLYRDLYESLPDFVHMREALQSFHAYGDRKDYPHLDDAQWSRISWDAFQDCFVCSQRHRCGQTLSRDHYRRSADLIVCSHDFYMEHVWTFEGRKREGQLPLLPEHSAVVFDEGHLLESAAQKALTYKLKHVVFEDLITRLLKGEVRESFAFLIEDAIAQSEAMFEVIERQSKPIPGSERRRVEVDGRLLEEIGRFQDILSNIEDELVFESELFTLNDYQLRIVEEHLEMMQKALSLFGRAEHPICWATDSANGLTLVIMPRLVKEVLREGVFGQQMPIVFSSATLSVEGSFDYVGSSLGAGDSLSFSVASPYDYESQLEVTAPVWSYRGTFSEKMKTAVSLLVRTGGRALLLFPAKDELQRFKSEIVHYPECGGMRFLFEGDREISDQISAFQQDEASVLCASSLWEGLDVPGPSLSNVIIWSLPFPPQEPVFEARRQAAANPYEEVDLPYMLLRLKQGMGRLIRSRQDRGIVAIFSEELHTSSELRAHVEGLLPNGVRLKTLEEVEFRWTDTPAEMK